MDLNQAARLRAEHKRLEAAIAAEQRRPLPNEVRLKTLKSRKLSVKDELWALQMGFAGRPH